MLRWLSGRVYFSPVSKQLITKVLLIRGGFPGPFGQDGRYAPQNRAGLLNHRPYLITPSKICIDQIRNIRSSMLARGGEEIVGGGATAPIAGSVILQEGKESVVAHAIV
jgi:hypothetical protein